jgi:hypothetical protein
MEEQARDDSGRAGRLGFLLIPGGVLPRPELTLTQKAVLSAIAVHQGDNAEAWPTAARLATELGVHPATVRRSVALLEGAGWLQVLGRRYPGGPLRYSLNGSRAAFWGSTGFAARKTLSETTPNRGKAGPAQAPLGLQGVRIPPEVAAGRPGAFPEDVHKPVENPQRLPRTSAQDAQTLCASCAEGVIQNPPQALPAAQVAAHAPERKKIREEDKTSTLVSEPWERRFRQLLDETGYPTDAGGRTALLPRLLPLSLRWLGVAEYQAERRLREVLIAGLRAQRPKPFAAAALMRGFSVSKAARREAAEEMDGEDSWLRRQGKRMPHGQGGVVALGAVVRALC